MFALTTVVAVVRSLSTSIQCIALSSSVLVHMKKPSPNVPALKQMHGKEKRRSSTRKSNKSIEQGLNLSRSQQQGYSTAYSTPFPFKSSAKDFPPLILVLRFMSQTADLSAYCPSLTNYGTQASEMLYFHSFHISRTNIIVSSTDSGLEAFSHNPADDSFAPLPARTGANTKYLNERFLSY